MSLWRSKKLSELLGFLEPREDVTLLVTAEVTVDVTPVTGLETLDVTLPVTLDVTGVIDAAPV